MMNQLLLASEAHHVPDWVTYVFAAILVLMILCLALEEKLHAKKSIIVGSFAGLCLILITVIDSAGVDLVSFKDVILPGGGKVHLPIYIPSIDWSVITIILGASLFVEVVSRSGVFTWMAIKLTKASAGDPSRLLFFYGLLTVLFSAVLNNVTAMIIIGSLTTVSLKKLKREDLLLGFLLTEGLLTNVGGLLTLISSVPNIIVGKTVPNVQNAAGEFISGKQPAIGFVDFFLYAAPYVLISTLVTLFMAKIMFGIRKLKTEEERSAARELVSGFDENESIPSQRFFWFSVAALVGFILALAGQSYLPWELNELGMGFVALFFAGLVLLAYKHDVDKFYSAVDWDLLAFFASLFVVIHVMEHAGVLNMIGSGIAGLLKASGVAAPGVLLASSAVASSVTDNIPLAAMLAKILQAQNTLGSSPYWWCVIFGANLGGNITPIGSASTLVAMTIIHRNKLHLTFTGFVKAAVPFAVVQIVLAIIYVALRAP